MNIENIRDRLNIENDNDYKSWTNRKDEVKPMYY